MNATLARDDPSARNTVAAAVHALRGIGRRHVVAAVVFGLALFVTDLVSFFVMLVIDTQAVRTPVMYVDMAIASQVRAFVLMAAIVIADDAVERGVPSRRAYVAAAIGGSLAGVLVTCVTSWPFMAWMMANAWPEHWLRGMQGFVFGILSDLTHWGLIASATVFLYADRRAARRTEARLQAAQLDRIRRSKTALESRLQAMQARVEPQFLFNTLAQVERLYELDPPTAARMLDDLIAYLRAAMPLMRDTSSSVAQEIELARSYLDIVRLRLGDRLRVSIDVPPEAAAARMPPMMLLPLIDHTVVRGLGPASEGGVVRISAQVEGDRLRMSIVDSGAALVPDMDADGIAAIRQRLDALYRGDASLEVRRADPRSTEAVLDLPLEQPGIVSVSPDRSSS